ncbi:uncharacterized protein LOC144108868 [Amblyomma americanum]
MSNIQRIHMSFAVIPFLLLSLFICMHRAFADPNKYFNTSSLCMTGPHYTIFRTIDGAVLTSESENNRDCFIVFQTDSILKRFMLRFEKLALDCNDHLKVFDGSQPIGNHKVDLSCGSTHTDVGTIFTLTNFVTLEYTTDNSSPAENGFKLIITAYKDIQTIGLKCRDFECLNSFCISSNLTCDGVNHCGDNSDETSHASCIGSTLSSAVTAP